MVNSRRAFGPPLLGLILVGLGLLFLLENLDVLEFDLGDLIRTWWPLLLVAFGIAHLARGARLSGGCLVLFGILFQLTKLDVFEIDSIFDWWPLALIAAGASLMLGSLRPGASRRGGEGSAAQDAGDTVRAFQIWGGTRRRLTSRAFRGGEVTAVMGGVVVDLRGAQPAAEGARLDVTVLMGGVELEVPVDWDVVVSGTPFLGGIEDKRATPPAAPGAAPRPRLGVRANILMGGLELRN